MEIKNKITLASTKRFIWKDKTGHGFSGSFTIHKILASEDKAGYRWSLHQWAEMANQGDEWDSLTMKYTCIEE